MTTHDTRTRWGRTKGGRAPAMAVAAPIGLALATLGGLVAAWTGIAGPRPLLGAAALAVCLTPVTLVGVWGLVVDRTTLAGAADRPEDSIESRWYDRAAAGAQTDVILVAGLAAAAFALAPADVDIAPELVLAGVVGVSFVCFAVRYQLLRRRG